LEMALALAAAGEVSFGGVYRVDYSGLSCTQLQGTAHAGAALLEMALALAAAGEVLTNQPTNQPASQPTNQLAT